MDRKTEKLLREYPTFDALWHPAADLKDRLALLDDFGSMEVFRRGRTGHHVTTEPSARHPKGRKVAHFGNAADAGFVCALVNSWHAGRLQVMPMEIPIEGEVSRDRRFQTSSPPLQRIMASPKPILNRTDGKPVWCMPGMSAFGWLKS